MEIDELRAIFDRQQRYEVEFPDALRQVTPEVVRHIIPARGVDVIVCSQLAGPDADAIIEREQANAAARGHRLSWKAYEHDAPPDLRSRLVAHGFEPEELEAVLVLDLQAGPQRLLAPPGAAAPHGAAAPPGAGDLPGVEVRRITRAAGMVDVIAVEEAVWRHDHSWLDELGQELERGSDLLGMYCAYVDGAPAAAGVDPFHPGSQFASIWGGSTVEAYRGRGLYRQLLAQRCREAGQRGYRFVTIDAGPMSEPIVAGYGFRLISHAQDHNWQPPELPAAAAEDQSKIG